MVSDSRPRFLYLKAAFRIHAILFRIRIRGSVPLTDSDPTPAPALFVSYLKYANKNFFAYHFFVHSLKEVTKKYKYFCLMMEGSGSGRPKSLRGMLRIRNIA
jgi:hypothetical protein